MSKYILLVLSLILLTAISIYAGIWSTDTKLEGIDDGIANGKKDWIILSESLNSQYTTDSCGNVVTVNDSCGNVVITGVATDSCGNVVTKPPLYDASTLDTITKYNSDNLGVEYHDDLPATGSNYLYNTQMGKAEVYDVNGNLVDVVSNAVQGNIVYYKPGSYKYGATSYVPYYEDSVFLSRATNAIINTPTNIGGGFCNKYKNNFLKIEEKCNTINNKTCAATECCVLLGGQKCVAGGKKGPTMKYKYRDFKILNKDFYYYKGKCYGNCPNTP